jgi:signal transduction histidine kinase
MTLFVSVAIPSVYHVLFQDVDRRLTAGVEDEMTEFRANLAQRKLQDLEELENFVIQYLDNDLVERDQYFIFIVNDRFFRSSPTELPPVLQSNSELMQKWLPLRQPFKSRRQTADPNIGTILYQGEPIFVGYQQSGMFIVVQTTASEWQETEQIIRTIWLVLFVILGLASAIAWYISGRILQPLRSMAMTARSIGESDLEQRIEVTGKGELAEVATTFNEMMDRLQSAFTSQQDFINDASHELRTPITIIQGHLELMGDDPEEQQEVLGLVNGELERMNRFVNDLLILAKAGRPDFIQPELVDLTSFTDELYQKAKVIADCELQLDEKGAGVVSIDRQRITQAILNLVENANQYTSAEGLITIGSSRSRRNLRFWVHDTGVGIAPADQKRIFERFARGTKQARKSEGAGLGLSIVQAIARGSGGKIDLKSQPGKGSTFTLIIPQRKR